jgi:glycosyltransferase involved in cell wall biosynthesis
VKIVFVNRFFFPDSSATSQMLSDLAIDLAQDHEVHVVTSRLEYDDPAAGLPAHEQVKGVVVHRVWTSRFGRRSHLGRTVDYLTFYLSSMLRLLAVLRAGDLVVVMTDPPLISVAAAVVGKLKRARIVNWLQDLFPEVANELDFKHLARTTGELLGWCRDRSLSMASCNVVLGDAMAAKVAGRAIPAERIRVIHNWSSGTQVRPLAPELNGLRREWGLDGKFVVGYSGNMGRAHDFTSLLGAAQQLAHRRDIVFLLIGAGKQRPDLEAAVSRQRLTNVMFRPYQPREILAQSLTAPDCHIVSLKPVLEGLIVPSKLYSSIAAGRPVIFLGAEDGEVGRLMKAGPAFGIRVDPEDVTGLVRAIEHLSADPGRSAALGLAGRRIFEQRFDQPIAVAKWRALIAETAAPPAHN